MSDITPGPWLFGFYEMTPTIFDSRGNGTIPIATVHDVVIEGAIPNAHLMEAAPDLLAACQMLLEWDDYGGDAVSMLEEAVEAAREAVVKAKESNDE